jgi:hypothetical protein
LLNGCGLADGFFIPCSSLGCNASLFLFFLLPFALPLRGALGCRPLPV